MLRGKDFHKCNHFLEMRFPGSEVSSTEEDAAKNLQSVQNRQTLLLDGTEPHLASLPSPLADG